MSVPMPVSTSISRPPPKPQPAPYISHTFHLSPDKFQCSECPCAVPPCSPHTPEDLIEIQLARLQSVWHGANGTTLPHEVKCAGHRVCKILAQSGINLAHLAAKILDVPDDRKRIEISALWLVRTVQKEDENGNDIGHEVIAEVLTHLHGRGSRVGSVAHVAVRFGSDWEDWTVSKAHEYNRVDGTQSVSFPVPHGVQGSSKQRQVLDQVWGEVRKLLQGECQPSSPEMNQRIARAVLGLKDQGKMLNSFEVEKIYRKSSDREGYNPVIRIALHVGDEDEVGAIVLIDTGVEAGKRNVKNIAVAYDGEWPITYHYRTLIPPPDIGGLKAMIKVDDATAG